MTPDDPSAPRPGPAFWAALAAAQGELTNPVAGLTAKVTTKTGPDYQYDYADLATIMAGVRLVLARHKLAMLHRIVQDEAVHVSTLIAHESGEGIEIWLSGPKPGTLQNLGGTITYLSRYGVQALLALAVDKDDDGNGADDKAASVGPRKPATLDDVRAHLVSRGFSPDRMAAIFVKVGVIMEDAQAGLVLEKLAKTPDERVREILAVPAAQPETKAETKADTKSPPDPGAASGEVAGKKAEPAAPKTLVDVKIELERRFYGPAQTDGDMTQAVIELFKACKLECTDENAAAVLGKLAKTQDARLKELLGSFFIPF